MSQITMLSLDEKTIASDLDRAGYKKMGISVKTASSHEDVIKTLGSTDVDIIVMNMDHTKVDVLDSVKRLKKYKQWAHIPVVLTSVQSSQKVKQLALQSGAEMFVEQPLPRDYFIEKIKNLLSKETRGQQRVSGTVTMTFNWNKKTVETDVGDLSTTGLLFFTDIGLTQGQEIEMSIQLGASNKTLKVKGEVVRVLPPDKRKNADGLPGIGVRFTSFAGDSQSRIESWVGRSADSTNKMAYYL